MRGIVVIVYVQHDRRRVWPQGHSDAGRAYAPPAHSPTPWRIGAADSHGPTKSTAGYMIACRSLRRIIIEIVVYFANIVLFRQARHVFPSTAGKGRAYSAIRYDAAVFESVDSPMRLVV